MAVISIGSTELFTSTEIFSS